ncbi:MAG TPA: protocatechuate 3,4-dioxygenase [Ideonella sp.]|nr:protocatechuate 3,4-dioxygenase [Ideonella sp.]
MNKPAPLSTRRRGLVAAAAASLATPLWVPRLQAQQPQRLALTPAQTEGPFYPVSLPADTDFDLLANGSQRYARGQAAWLQGQVTDVEGRPVRGAVVEIWQCDEAGHYHHPGDGRADPAFQGFGRVAVDGSGAYRFRTLRPVAYSGRTPHIHLKVKLGSRELLTTQLYVEGDAGNARDGLWRGLSPADRLAVTRPFQPVADGLAVQFPLVVAA